MSNPHSKSHLMYSTLPNIIIGFHGCDQKVFEKIPFLSQFCLENHWTIRPVGFIIYSVLVSLQADQIFWGKREFGKEKTEVML